MYIYESHMGGLYVLSEELPWEALYCEVCGDADRLVGFAETQEEARKLLENHADDMDTVWDSEYIRKFLKENWGE